MEIDTDRLTPEECYKLVGVHHPKVPVCRRPEYEIMFEQFGAYTFAHARFFKPWTQEVKRKFKADADALVALHGGPLFVFIKNGDVKLRKFARMAGFRHAMNVVTFDGTPAEIMARQ